MIDLNSLVKAIQDASLAAVTAVSNEHLKILDRYFEVVDEPENSLNTNRKSTRKSLTQQLATQVPHDDYDDTIQKFKPKTVTIQFPKETANGFEIHDVHVPLLTLMPISLPQISELRFTTDLEIAVDPNDLLKVSFPTQRKDRKLMKNKDQQDQVTSAKLEIVFNDATLSDGLQKIVEGYEKALRAQIPG